MLSQATSRDRSSLRETRVELASAADRTAAAERAASQLRLELEKARELGGSEVRRLQRSLKEAMAELQQARETVLEQHTGQQKQQMEGSKVGHDPRSSAVSCDALRGYFQWS